MGSLFDIFDGASEAEEIATVLAESANPANDLVEDLCHWLEHGKTEPARAPGLHCSSLWKTCARRPPLEHMYANYLTTEVIKAGSRMTFDMGHSIHNLIQNGYLGPFKRLYGEWKCLVCQDIIHKGIMPDACPKCDIPWRNEKDGDQNIVYSELFVKDDALNYCGHCDGVLLGRDNKTKRVFEFKTISKSQYGSLRQPKSAHVMQVHAYMNGLGLKEAVVLYWDKGSQCDWSRDPDGSWISGKPHLKSFLVKWDDELWNAMVKRIHDYHAATELVRTLPTVGTDTVMQFPRVCTHDGCDMARDCPVARWCFGLPR